MILITPENDWTASLYGPENGDTADGLVMSGYLKMMANRTLWLRGQLDAKAGTGHSHGIGEIAGLPEALASKAPLGHQHQVSEIPGLVEMFNALTNRVTALENAGGGTGPNPGTITADFAFTKSGADQRTVAFDATASTTNGHAIVAYEWAFGDGATSTAQDPSHTYSGYGTYTVSLLVRDSSGAQKAVQTQIEFPQTTYYATHKLSASLTQGGNGRFYYTGNPAWQPSSGMAAGLAKVLGNTASGFAVRVPVPVSATGLTIASATLHVTGSVGGPQSTIESVTSRIYRSAPASAAVTPFSTLTDLNPYGENATAEAQAPTTVARAFDPAVQSAGYWEFWFDVDAGVGAAEQMDLSNVYVTVTWA